MPTSRTTAKQKTTSSSSASRPKPKSVAPLQTVDGKNSPLDGGSGYEIFKQVNLPQIQDEISKATEADNVNVAITSADDEADRQVLWLTPAGLDSTAIAQVVADHIPDSMWGVPAVIQSFNAALSRLRDNPDADLAEGDLEVLVKGIALNFTALMPPSI